VSPNLIEHKGKEGVTYDSSEVSLDPQVLEPLEYKVGKEPFTMSEVSDQEVPKIERVQNMSLNLIEYKVLNKESLTTNISEARILRI
jgi:hypothetical protein